jgi:hypothetical protein
MSQIQAHDSAEQGVLVEDVRIVELASRVCSRYKRQSPKEKARLLRVILSNCTVENGTPSLEHGNAFDTLAEGVRTREWLVTLDRYGTFWIDPPAGSMGFHQQVEAGMGTLQDLRNASSCQG